MTEKLPLFDRIPLQLRALYESHGYQKYRMDKFETYDTYRENKSFLTGERIITFTGAGGRLMALKPDVTISIIKNVAPEALREKLFYDENVFRMKKSDGEVREIGQTGLEYIGADDAYSEAEVVILAAKSLALLDGNYILNIGHMGFLTGIFEDLSEELSDALAGKNRTALEKICGDGELAQTLCTLCEKPTPELGFLQGLVKNERTRAAFEELKALAGLLCAAGLENRVRIDFSTVNSPDYYNGIVMRGYISKAASAVLAGGRYDSMMRRFGKPQNATGFAIYLGELERVFYEPPEYDTDILLVYGNSDPCEVLERAEEMRAHGFSVRAERDQNAGVRAGKTIVLGENQDA